MGSRRPAATQEMKPFLFLRGEIMEIEKIVNEKFLEIIQSGKIEKMIEEKLLSSIEAVIKDCLSSYGKLGDEIKKQFLESLMAGNIKFDFPSYNQLICNWVTEIIDKQIIQSGKEQIQENLKQFFKPLKKSEYKISEIIEKFKDFVFDESDGEKKITFIKEETDYGYIHFYLDEEAEKKKYECNYQIDINKEGIIYNADIGGLKAKDIKLKPLYGFDSFLFKLFASKITIIDDSENVDTLYCPYND